MNSESPSPMTLLFTFKFIFMVLLVEILRHLLSTAKKQSTLTMSVSQAIRFRHLINQLSIQEKQTLILQLLNKPNDIITKSLFYCCIHSDNHNDATNVNDMISKIIRKRDKVPIDPPQFKLDMIPKALIGHIASFSNQSDYANLSIANRSVFLGCNSPNMLQKLQLHQEHQCSNIKLDLYPSIKYFEFSLQQFDEFRISTPTALPLFNQLNEFIDGNLIDL